MAGYAIDLTSPLIHQAMLEEGILPSELQLKSLQDFAAPKLNPEIQQIRYNFHVKRLQETIKLIKQRIKTMRLSRKKELVFSEIQQQTRKKPELKKEIKLKPSFSHPQINLLSPTLSEITKKLELVEELKGEIRKNQMELSEKKKGHDEFVRHLELSQAQLHKDLIRNLAKSEGKERKNEPKQENSLEIKEKPKKSWKKRGNFELFEENIEAKLMEIESKIASNRENHSKMLENKAKRAAEKTAKATEYAHNLAGLRAVLEEERIKTYISKQTSQTSRLKTEKETPPTTGRTGSKAVTSRVNPARDTKPSSPCFPRSQSIDPALHSEHLRLKHLTSSLKVTHAKRRFVSFT